MTRIHGRRTSPWSGRALLAAGSLAMGCYSDPPLPVSSFEDSSMTVAPHWQGDGLRPGDLLVVKVFGHPEFSTPDGGLRVDLEGNLALPFLDAVPVAGRTVAAARAEIAERLRPFLLEPRVLVSLQSVAPRSFYIVGEVERPGRYELTSPISALQGLALGGPFRAGADRAEVVLLRAHGEQLETHLFSLATPSTSGLVAVEPDDVIFVRRSGGGAFLSEMLPYLQATAFATGSVANLVFTLNALDGR